MKPPITSRAAALSATVAVALAASAGCASHAQFRPVTSNDHDIVRAPPPSMVGAIYDIELEQRRAGTFKVWTRGVSLDHENDLRPGAAAAIHIGTRVTNDGLVPLVLATRPLELDVELEDGRMLVLEDPVSLSGDPTAPPGGIARFEILFALPAGIMPDEVRAYEVTWRVGDNGSRFSDSTRFVRYDVPEGTAYWIYEPYDYDGFPYSYPAHSLPRAGSAATGS